MHVVIDHNLVEMSNSDRILIRPDGSALFFVDGTFIFRNSAGYYTVMSGDVAADMLEGAETDEANVDVVQAALRAIREGLGLP